MNVEDAFAASQAGHSDAATSAAATERPDTEAFLATSGPRQSTLPAHDDSTTTSFVAAQHPNNARAAHHAVARFAAP
eukprot:CAMPEP_0198538434 /NCGR_PEP_ID=MMETSP1462-20131121/47872_1 /TAXON_ID=1333877 /ORGANISM="Brandtodinium nutriculum, Strain RCC3387" /LENGTH=76 /DNA_ID=CAMNT_0044268459 /DNA_START=319 /DNA_END=545 /DNA_ORIENTATION=+